MNKIRIPAIQRFTEVEIRKQQRNFPLDNGKSGSSYIIRGEFKLRR